jgi:ADP-ribosylglycohydrolase
VNEKGEEITYAEDGASKARYCFGGEPGIVRDLCRRDWTQIQKALSRPGEILPHSLFSQSRPKRGRAVAHPGLLSRAQGALMGQCAGDAFGQQVEFLDSESIYKMHPRGLELMLDGGTHNTMAGQPTDDSEMALMLARSIVQEGKYDSEKVAQAYQYWSQTPPFDIGNTIRKAVHSITQTNIQEGETAKAMQQAADPGSQANGSLMRISPLAIYGYRLRIDELWNMAREESALTHPHPICRDACAVYVATLADAIASGRGPDDLYERALRLAADKNAEEPVQAALREAASTAPDFNQRQGWVLVAFQNAYYELLHSHSLDKVIIETTLRGGDTDTNAAIAGALAGAVYGRDAIPFQWRQMVLSCRSHKNAGAQHPRPHCFWPVDLYTLAEALLITG